MSSVQIHVLGRIEVTHDDGSEAEIQPGLRQLLALLVAAGPKGGSLDWLADEVWGEELPSKWQAAMRMAISRLRRQTGLTILNRNGRYKLDIDPSQADAWALLAAQKRDDPWSPVLEPLVAERGIFPSVEISPALRIAMVELEAAQRWAIEKLAQEPLRQSRQVLASLARRVHEDPFDVALCLAIAAVHANSGVPVEALALIDRCREAYTEDYPAGAPPELDDLRQHIQSQVPVGAQPGPARSPALVPAGPRLPFYLVHCRAANFVGRSHELDQLTRLARLTGPESSSVMVVRGRPGSGKTGLVAEAGHRLARDGAYIVYLAGSPGGRVALAPLTAAVPDFAAEVSAADSQDVDAATRLRLLTTSLLKLLTLEASGRRIVVLVDDAQWLDGSTCEIIDYLARSSTGEHPVALLISARTKPEARTPWTDLQARLDRLAHVSHLLLGPLTEPEVAEIVAAKRPRHSYSSQRQLASWLHRASGGYPAVALALLDLDDRDGTRAENEVESGTGSGGEDEVFDRRVETVGPEVRRVCASAAVLGHRFRLPDLARLLGRSEDSLLDELEVAISAELAAETGSLYEYEFPHQLVSEAFLRSISDLRRARLHRDACELTTNVHELARHHIGARDLVDQDRAVEAVLASARAHLADRSYWESAAQFRQANHLADGHLDITAYVDYARALSLSGARRASRGVRARAYDLAVAAGEWSLAHDAAVSGLPEADVHDGEEDRQAQLGAIPPDRLDSRRRLSQALTSARLATQLGRPDEARDWAERAAALATTAEERVDAALTDRLAATVVDPPAVRLARLSAAVGNLDISPPSLCRIAQVRAIDELERGGLDAATNALDTFEQLATKTADPLRCWHATVFRALLHEIDGHWDTADELAAEARRFGQQFAIAESEIVFLGHQYFRFLLTGQLGRLADRIDQVPEPDADSLLFKASKARVLVAGGRQDEGVELAGRVARSILDRPPVLGLSGLAFAVPALARHESSELRAEVRDALAPFGASFTVVGVGIGLLGPLDLLASELGDGTERHRQHALEQAIEVVDTCRFRSLQVRYRLDLAELTGSQEPLDRAREIAEGTSLTELL